VLLSAKSKDGLGLENSKSLQLKPLGWDDKPQGAIRSTGVFTQPRHLDADRMANHERQLHWHIVLFSSAHKMTASFQKEVKIQGGKSGTAFNFHL
jgi:hypothetical protein